MDDCLPSSRQHCLSGALVPCLRPRYLRSTADAAAAMAHACRATVGNPVYGHPPVPPLPRLCSCHAQGPCCDCRHPHRLSKTRVSYLSHDLHRLHDSHPLWGAGLMCCAAAASAAVAVGAWTPQRMACTHSVRVTTADQHTDGLGHACALAEDGGGRFAAGEAPAAAAVLGEVAARLIPGSHHSAASSAVGGRA